MIDCKTVGSDLSPVSLPILNIVTLTPNLLCKDHTHSYDQCKIQTFCRQQVHIPLMPDFRNRKHVPCFCGVEVWENVKCCGNTSRRRVFPQLFRVLPNFHECFYNSIETRRTCFLFLLENAVMKKTKTTC